MITQEAQLKEQLAESTKVKEFLKCLSEQNIKIAQSKCARYGLDYVKEFVSDNQQSGFGVGRFQQTKKYPMTPSIGGKKLNLGSPSSKNTFRDKLNAQKPKNKLESLLNTEK